MQDGSDQCYVSCLDIPSAAASDCWVGLFLISGTVNSGLKIVLIYCVTYNCLWIRKTDTFKIKLLLVLTVLVDLLLELENL